MDVGLAQEESAHSWEFSKENILPTRRGRKLKHIAEDIEASKSVTLGASDPHTQRLNIQTEAWRERIRNEAEEGVDDPLRLWVKFLRWSEQAHSRGSSTDETNRLYEDCFEALMDVPRYHNDERFYENVIAPYADLNEAHALTLFGFLENRRFFQTVARFYLGWAIAAEIVGRLDEAARVYQLGIDRHAVPEGFLQEKLEQFRLRTADTLGTISESDPSATHGFAHTLAPVDDSEARFFQAQGQQQFSRGLASTLAAEQVSIAVFDENDPNASNTAPTMLGGPAQLQSGDGTTADFDLQSHVAAWKKFGRLSENRKENTMAPQKWNEVKPLTSANAVGAAGFSVLDENEAGAGDNGFTVFDENPELPAHLAARVREAPAATTETVSNTAEREEVAQEPAAPAPAVVSSNDFFANIFEDAPAPKPTASKKDRAKAALKKAMLGFYKAHNPEKAAHVDMFLQRFRGKEHHIAKMLRKKYPDVDLRAIESAGRDIKRARAAESE